MEKTLVLIKPDAVRGKHIGDIVKIYEEKGLKILAMKMLQMDEKLASKHYEEHIGRPYYEDLMGFMTSGPIVAMVLEGEGAIANVRAIMARLSSARLLRALSASCTQPAAAATRCTLLTRLRMLQGRFPFSLMPPKFSTEFD